MIERWCLSFFVFMASQRLFLKGIMFRFRHDNITHGCHSSGKFRVKWITSRSENFTLSQRKFTSFPPSFFWVKKKKRICRRKKSRQGKRRKNTLPPSESGDTFLFDVDYVHSGQIPDNYILSLCNAS